MHWLQSLDHALFHFINSTLANPFFDWLMPVLSGQGVPWLIAAVIAVPLILWLGSLRLKVLALAMVLVVAIGDPLIVGTIKNSVLRARPFVVVPDARLFGQIGKGYVPPLPDGTLPPTANRHSLPSAHSANWFAMAMLAFLYYRRTGWVMFPLAAAVAFSRVYNGVHYPSDVAIGAILGAGYAIAFLVLFQTLWTLAGKRFFPAWHSRLPNLLKPEPTPATTTLESTAPRDWLNLGYLLLLAALIGRWIYIASGTLGLSSDEAYQWLWSKHLALSYYSKPAGIALIQWAGTHLFGDTDFGVRFFSPLFAALLSVLLFRFIVRHAGARAAFCLLLITFATPLLVAGSVLMTIDPPQVLCWMWAVIAGWRAVQADGQTRDWFIAGLAMGLGFLCKQAAAFQLICWGIFFALQPSARAHLRKPGPWLALLVFGICALPPVIWNMQHGWITALHIWGDAGMTGHAGEQISLLDRVLKSLNYVTDFTAGELAALNPVFFVGALWAMAAAWKRRAEKPLWFFLLCMSAPVFLGYWLWSFHSRVQLNWIASAVPAMFCLMVLVWNESKRHFKPWLAGGVLLGIAASVFLYDAGLIGKLAGQKLPGDVDPSHVHFAKGGREMARLVESEREKFDPHAFIIADHYGTTGIDSFYSAAARAAAKTDRPLVYCIDSDTPIDQFAYWDQYNYRKHRQGENALFVVRLDPYKLERGWIWKWLRHEPVGVRERPPTPSAQRMAAEFETVTNLGVREVKLPDGRAIQRVQLFGCYRLK